MIGAPDRAFRPQPLLVLLATLMLTGIGIWAVANTPLDALPDLSDTQVIVYTEYPGQAPQVVEDQVTYPLTTALLAVPHAKVVRGFSNFAVSFVYVVFDDGTDLYWARSRVLEYLNFAAKRLPEGVTPTLGPGCERRRLGLRICRARRAAHARRAAQHPGLDRALPARHRQRRRRSGERRRLRAAISGRRRSAEAAGLRHSRSTGSPTPSAPATRMSAAGQSR